MTIPTDLLPLRDAMRAKLAAATETAPSGAPTEAEIEAWEKVAKIDSLDARMARFQPDAEHIGTVDELFALTREEIDQAVALMRRASASPPAPAVQPSEAEIEPHLLPNAPWRRRSHGRQFDGYYIHFETTGVEDVDEVLRAVAYAGKSYHNIEGWADDENKQDGKTCVEWIQEAAQNAADAMSGLRHRPRPRSHPLAGE